MGIYEVFGTNQTAEKEGVSVLMGMTDEGKEIRFTIARQNTTNKKFQAAVDKKIAPYRQLIAMEQASVELLRRLTMEVFCESILLGWENVDSEDGKPLDFNYENALWLFKRLPDLYDQLNDKSKSSLTFKDDSAKVVVKN